MLQTQTFGLVVSHYSLFNILDNLFSDSILHTLILPEINDYYFTELNDDNKGSRVSEKR